MLNPEVTHAAFSLKPIDTADVNGAAPRLYDAVGIPFSMNICRLLPSSHQYLPQWALRPYSAQGRIRCDPVFGVRLGPLGFEPRTKGFMRRLDSAILVGHQALTRVTKLCVRKCASKYRVFDRGFLDQKHFRMQSLCKN